MKMMSCATPTRMKSWRAITCSLVTVVALLVTPACAPMCAAKSCLQAATVNASEQHCHAASTHDNVAQIHSFQNCGAPELPVAALTSGNESDALQASRPVAAHAIPYVLPSELTGISAVDGGQCCTKPDSLRLPDSLLTTSVLRI